MPAEPGFPIRQTAATYPTRMMCSIQAIAAYLADAEPPAPAGEALNHCRKIDCEQSAQYSIHRLTGVGNSDSSGQPQLPRPP